MLERLNSKIDRAPVSNELLIRGHQLVPEYVRQVADLVAIGRDKLSEGIGYHGTSLASLLIAMKTGHIPLGRSKGCAGHLYFYPLSHVELQDKGIFQLDADPKKADQEAYTGASWYARNLSQAAFCAALMGVDLQSPQGWRVASGREAIADGQDLGGLELLSQQGVSQRELSRINLSLDKAHRGFVLVLGRSALENFPCSAGDPGEGDLKLTPPAPGLSLDHIVGIEPLSAEDFDTVEQLSGN